jgi:transcription-repair coupling factor (superfamily II helicase)
VAVRAAFKAVADSKQVAILVPTTILAAQHYKTFTDRLKGFPANIDYINRFKTSKQIKDTLRETERGQGRYHHRYTPFGEQGCEV